MLVALTLWTVRFVLVKLPKSELENDRDEFAPGVVPNDTLPKSSLAKPDKEPVPPLLLETRSPMVKVFALKISPVGSPSAIPPPVSANARVELPARAFAPGIRHANEAITRIAARRRIIQVLLASCSQMFRC